MCDGITRLNAALGGEPADRIPVFCNLLDQGAGELRVSLAEYYSRGDLVAEAQLAMREKYGYDNVWCLFYVGRDAELLGCQELLFAAGGPPNIAHFVLESEAAIEGLTIPSVAELEAHPAFAEVRRCLVLLREAVGGRYPICAYLTASTALPSLLMGMERWLELLLLGPVAVRELLLQKCSLFAARLLSIYRRLGVDLVLYAQPFGSTEMLPARLIEGIVLPWSARDLAGDSKSGVIYYGGTSPIMPVLRRVQKALGLQTFYLGPRESVPEARELAGDRALLVGTINDIALIDWSPDRIRGEVGRIVASGMNDGPFAFGTLMMPLRVPHEAIRLMLETAYAAGSWERRGPT